MATTFLAGVVVATNRFKVPPLMSDLMADLQVDMVTGGWFMSVASLAFVFLSIPSAYLLARLGLKVTGLIALGCTIAGTVVGALATNAATMLLGRTVEGIGGGLLGIVAPAAISAWFEPQERGLPMGVRRESVLNDCSMQECMLNLLFHQQYPTRYRGEVTNRVKPAYNVSRSLKTAAEPVRRWQVC
jgi:MFS family permease